MKKSVRYTVVFELLAVLLLLLSGAVPGTLSTVLYYAAFVIPVALFFAIGKSVSPEPKNLKPLPTAKDGATVALLLAPTLLGVIGLSALFSYLASLISSPDDATLTGSFFTLFLLHALLSSVLEELVFRYIPIALISPHSKRSAVLISAVFFALVHTNLAQIPYALFAGLVFAAVDIATGSILPSVVFHLVNNTVSLLLQWERTAELFTVPAVITVAALAVISVGVIIALRKKFRELFSFAFDKSDKLAFTTEAAVFVLLMLFITVTALF